MGNREKIAWGLAVLSVVIMAGYYFATKAAAEKTRNRYEEQIAGLIEVKASLELKAERLAEQVEGFKRENRDLNEDLNRKVAVIADLKANPGDPVYIKVDSTDCQKCFADHSLPVTVTDDKGWIETEVRDAFRPRKGATITFLPAFFDEYIEPREQALDDCSDSLATCRAALDRRIDPPDPDPDPFFSLNVSHSVFVGTGYIPSGDIGLAGYYSGRFARLGSRDSIHVQMGVDAGAFVRFDGTMVQPFIIAGGQIEW